VTELFALEAATVVVFIAVLTVVFDVNWLTIPVASAIENIFIF
jgi:hypothetical protein